MNTKLTVVVDNVSSGQLKGEWGLAIMIEHNGRKILLDTGASELFMENMEKLGIDVKEVEYAVLSHAHYDHANGMPRFFKENEHAKFYLREGSQENCYVKALIFRRYIGIPKNVLMEYADRIEMVSGDTELCEGVYLIPHKTSGLSSAGKREKMYRKTASGWKPDDFSHEQSVVLDTDKGLVILNCCCHGGAVNIINEVTETFPDKKVYGIIGGFHLYNKSEEEVREVSRRIKETGIEFVCTGHCTMDKAYGVMREEIGDRLFQLRCGLKMIF